MQFPELRLRALLEGAEAIADNTDEAVRVELRRRVGSRFEVPALTSQTNCAAIDIGDSIWADGVELILEALCNLLGGLVGQVSALLSGIIGTFLANMNELFAQVLSTLSGFVTLIRDTLQQAFVGIVEAVREALDAVVTTLAQVIDGVVDRMRELLDGLTDIVSGVFAAIGTAVEALVDRVTEGFQALLSAAGAVLDRIVSGIQAVIRAVVDAAQAVFSTVAGALDELIRTLTGAAEAGLGRVREAVESIPEALRALADDAVGVVRSAIGEPLGQVGTLFIEQVDAFFDQLIEDGVVNVRQSVAGILERAGVPPAVAQRVAGSVEEGTPKAQIITAAALVFLIPFVVGPVVNAVLTPPLEELQQEVNQLVTPTLIPTANALDAFIRGEITEDRLRGELSQAGFSQERTDVLINASFRVIDVQLALTWWLRGIIDEEEFNRLMARQGIEPRDQERIKESAFFIPPVSDLIRMAVREVFSPEVRRRFGQDEDFPAEFEEFTAQQGVSLEWARNYWAAHWALPSVTQGFEMFHRKVIDRETLELLLRAQDVMPFWRERLTEIAFRPLTRVDIRRMHKLGLLTEQQLQERYEAIGFSPADAGLMVQFTLAFNAEEPTEQADELAGLTRATVLGMFEDRILDEEQTRGILVALGLSEDAATLFVTQRKLEIERADRRQQVEIILARTRAGDLSFDQAQDQLNGLGLEPAEVEKAVTELLRRRAAETQLPTRADLDRMRKADLIGDAEYLDTLGRLGFSRVWAERFLALVRRA